MSQFLIHLLHFLRLMLGHVLVLQEVVDLV